MNERKAWQESGARRRFPKADVLKYLFVISILGLEVGERARNIFPSALMMGENRNDYTWGAGQRGIPRYLQGIP